MSVSGEQSLVTVLSFRKQIDILTNHLLDTVQENVSEEFLNHCWH